MRAGRISYTLACGTEDLPIVYQRVLVAFDSSDTSRVALGQAIRLVKTLNGRLCIVHGLDIVTVDVASEPDRERAVAAAFQAGEETLHRATAIAREAGIDPETRLVEVDLMGRRRLPELVVQAATSWNADLIVVGTHGRRGIGNLLLGSVAEGIVRIAPLPVLIVRGAAEQAATPEEAAPLFRTILVAVDGSSISDRALREVLPLARELQSALRVIHVVTGKGEETAQAGKDVIGRATAAGEQAEVPVETRVLEAPAHSRTIADAVSAEAAAWPAELVVAGTHGRSGLSRLLLGSVAEAVVRTVRTPVLLIHSE